MVMPGTAFEWSRQENELYSERPGAILVTWNKYIIIADELTSNSFEGVETKREFILRLTAKFQ